MSYPRRFEEQLCPKFRIQLSPHIPTTKLEVVMRMSEVGLPLVLNLACGFVRFTGDMPVEMPRTRCYFTVICETLDLEIDSQRPKRILESTGVKTLTFQNHVKLNFYKGQRSWTGMSKLSGN